MDPRLRHADERDFEDRVSFDPTVVAPKPFVESSESLMTRDVSPPTEAVSVSTMEAQSGLFFPSFVIGNRTAEEDMPAERRRKVSQEG